MNIDRVTQAFEVDVLGSVQARSHGKRVRVPGPKQQALLAMLAMADGSAVPVGILLEALWEDLPGNPEHALRAHVSRLRQLINMPIEWGHGGYRLLHSPDRVDAVVFAQQCARGRQAVDAEDYAAAAQTLSAALQLWRGAAFAGVPDTPGLRPQRARLETLRLRAIGDRLDALIGTGDVGQAADEARILVAAEPLHERYWGHLITALSTDGRRAEALAAYQELRGVLRGELGSEPGQRLHDLNVAILRAANEPGSTGG